MKTRQDAWTEENDVLLAETVIRHIREGSTQLNAFDEVGDLLNRTSAACGFRWNAVVRHQHISAIDSAKKTRKQRHRLLGKQTTIRKNLLYQPPELFSPDFPLPETEYIELFPSEDMSNMSLSHIIHYLQNFQQSLRDYDFMKVENERLLRINQDLLSKNRDLELKVSQLETDSVTIQEDYDTIMQIMNRARKLVLFEEENPSAGKFRMDRNGNLEKVAE